jgi:ABC-2 type transport system ATP-binding protein
MTSPTARSAIAVAGLRKSFGDKVVLDGIDLRVAEGTIFALLGPNGAGKTTMVQILSTLIGADAGELAVGGHDLARDPDAVRSAIGVTGQFSAVDNLLTGEENLLLMADLRHWAARRGGGGPPSCSTASSWPRRPGSRPAPIPAACAAGSTWPWA